jgi:ligand-binding sensor domain-containing protein
MWFLAAATAAEPLVVHEHWGVEDGLPVDAVNDLAFDPTGYLWIATFDGLVRFDGARFVVFGAEDTPGLPSNRLVTVRTTPDGRILFGTEAGHVGWFSPGDGAWVSALPRPAKIGRAHV